MIKVLVWPEGVPRCRGSDEDKSSGWLASAWLPVNSSGVSCHNTWWYHWLSIYQWHSKALRGPGSTVTWGPSIPSAGPQRLKLEARSAESGGGALEREGLLPRKHWSRVSKLIANCKTVTHNILLFTVNYTYQQLRWSAEICQSKTLNASLLYMMNDNVSVDTSHQVTVILCS